MENMLIHKMDLNSSPPSQSPSPPPPSPLSLSSPVSFNSGNSFDDKVDRLIAQEFGELPYNTNAKKNGYRQKEPYPHIFEIRKGTKYLLKFYDSFPYEGLIRDEWNFYKTIYAVTKNTEYAKYFVQGVRGGEFEGIPYILMPYVENITLEDYVKGTVDITDLCNILSHVTHVVYFLFTKGLCHGDMHAGNVLITNDGVKIIDFDKAGECDKPLEAGYARFKGRNALRRNMNFIGTGHFPPTGFFVMCKDIFAHIPKLVKYVPRIDEIIKEYVAEEDIPRAYKAILALFDEIKDTQAGGRKTRKTKR